MRPDFRLLHTISGLAYLNGTRLVKTTDVFPPWNRQNWEEKKEVDFIACETTRNTNEESLRRMQTGMEALFNKSVQQLSMVRVRHLFPRCLCQRWSSRWATGSVLKSVEAGSRKPSGIWVFHLIHLWTHMWPTEADDSAADKWHSAWS